MEAYSPRTVQTSQNTAVPNPRMLHAINQLIAVGQRRYYLNIGEVDVAVVVVVVVAHALPTARESGCLAVPAGWFASPSPNLPSALELHTSYQFLHFDPF